MGAEDGERVGQLGVGVDPHGVLGAGTGRLEDQRVADRGCEGPHLVGVVGCGRGGRRHARLTERLLHRGLVAAQPGRVHRRAGDAGGLADLRSRHGVRLHRRLEAVDHPVPDVRTASVISCTLVTRPFL